MTVRLIIAIDGPAGSGKTTVARELARELGLRHIDTGAMYRAFALAVSRLGISEHEPAEFVPLLDKVDIRLSDGTMFLNAEDVSAEIRSSTVDKVVSPVAAVPEVRRWMVERQQHLAGDSGGVVEGRDIGTVVFPGADLKVFLTAESSERARRRAAQNEQDEMHSALESISHRDRLDMERQASPLKAATDAVVIDSTHKTAEQIVAAILQLLQERGLL